MRLANVKLFDIENGYGVGVSIFVQGCPHHCPGCFNQSTWDFDGGEEWTPEKEDTLIENCSPWYITRLSILGGEPVCKPNIDDVIHLAKRFKQEFRNKELWLYTGGYLSDVPEELRKYCDYIVDGPFEEDKKDLTLEFRGSSNQLVWQNTHITNSAGETVYILCEDIKQQI